MKQNGSENQYQLDAGQKQFGATQCTECGVVYQIGDPEDENAHLNYHNNRRTLKFPVCNIYVHAAHTNNPLNMFCNCKPLNYRVGRQNV